MISSTSGREVGDHLRPAAGIALQRLASELQLDPQRDQVLLGSVVEIALDLAAGAIGGARQPLARGGHVLQ